MAQKRKSLNPETIRSRDDFDWRSLANMNAVFASFPEKLTAETELRAFTAGETLFLRGTRPKAMLYVFNGEIRLIRHTAGGRQVVLQRSRNGFVAEASMESKTYHCDVVAAATGNLLMFPIAAFRRALNDDPAFRQIWISSLAAEVRRLRAQSERLHLNKAADRVVHFIAAEGKDGTLVLSQSRKAWAAELGLSHEALYRALARLQQQGLVGIDGARISLT